MPSEWASGDKKVYTRTVAGWTRKTRVSWRWTDQFDARGFEDADWNNKLQMVLEIPIGDLLGDKLLGASYNFHVNFVTGRTTATKHCSLIN